MFFFPANVRELSMLLCWALVFIFMVFAGGFGLGTGGLMDPPLGMPGIIWMLFMFTAGLATATVALMMFKERVDPWESQRILMEASGQSLPETATVTKETLLYMALIWEEHEETLKPLLEALDRHHVAQMMHEDTTSRVAPTPGLAAAISVIRNSSVALHYNARTLKQALVRVPGTLTIPLKRDEAVEIADGITDTAVVVAGASLATGIPGAACYREVSESNLSKRNPITGIIDKDAAGKWIKGSEYREADLERVLDEHAAIPMLDPDTVAGVYAEVK